MEEYALGTDWKQYVERLEMFFEDNMCCYSNG